jgi:two-component system, LytTR family, response regulator
MSNDQISGTYTPLRDRGEGITAVILDDEQHSIDLILYYAKQIPYLNIVASYLDPLDALDKMKDVAPVDLIFLDIHLPHLTALEFMQRIPYKSKIILVTAYTEVNVAEYGEDVIDYLVKPFTFTMFEKAVNKANIL